MDDLRRDQWLRFVLKIALLLVFLVYTNPPHELYNLKTNGSQSSYTIPYLSNFLNSHVRRLLFKEEFFNIHIASLLKHGPYSYSVGLAGFWVKSTFWSTIPGWFLIFQILLAIVENAQTLKFYWFEFVVSVLWFIFISQVLESSFHNEKYESTFYLLSSLCSYAVANLVLFPTHSFKKSSLHPGSMIYSMSSTILVFLTLMQESPGYHHSFQWNGLEVITSQCCLGLLMLQLLLGSPMGISGCITGGIMYAFVISRIFEQNNW